MIKTLFADDLELSPRGRRLVQIATLFYGCFLLLVCFLPQDFYIRDEDLITPGIVQWGRLYFLPVLFNSLVNAGQIDSWSDFGLILAQNVMNVFLLFPLVSCMLFLSPQWRSKKKVLFYSFLISLGIELTQLFLDVLIDAGRVFELDDLWTNSLGGLLAFGFYRFFITYLKQKQAPDR